MVYIYLFSFILISNSLALCFIKMNLFLLISQVNILDSISLNGPQQDQERLRCFDCVCRIHHLDSETRSPNNYAGSKLTEFGQMKLGRITDINSEKETPHIQKEVRGCRDQRETTGLPHAEDPNLYHRTFPPNGPLILGSFLA